jgi:uncharacterized repeat protein (TIGR01451 family)
MLDHRLTLVTKTRRIAGPIVAIALALAIAGSAQAYQAAPGWTASDYVTGFTFATGGAGPGGLAFDGSGNLFVGVNTSATLHKVPPGGGTASSTMLRGGYPSITGLTFDKSGRLYMARVNQHDVVELNPANGAVIRTAATGFACPVGLATDPISGDLFVSNISCANGGIFRISNFQNGPGTATRYAGTQDGDGLTFAPDGTLYAAGGNTIVRIAGTNASDPGSAAVIADVPTADGIAYAPATTTSDAFLVAARNDGEIDRVGLDGSVTPVVTGGSRGDLVTVGPDQCMYADLQDRVIKVGPSLGNCAFSPPAGPAAGGDGGGDGGGVVGQGTAGRTVDTAVRAKAPKRVRRGKRFALDVVVTNLSQNVAHSPVTTDTLPRGTKFVGARSAKGVSCKRRGKRSIACSMKSLEGGKSFTVKILVRAARGSSYTNSASVSSNDLDPSPGNNKSRSRTRLRRG